MKSTLRIYLIFGLKLAIAFWLFSFCRILFYLFNASFFPQPELINFLGGLRFDWMSITILYSPFLLGILFFPSTRSKVLHFLFLLSSGLGLTFNLIDFEYFKFTSKRTTFDLFKTSGLQEDLTNLIPLFIKDYWYLIILFIFTLACVSWMYKKVDRIERKRLSWKQYPFFFLSLIALYFLGFRGGYQYRPLNVIQAAQYAKAQNIPLVLNTPFTIMKSSYKESITVNEYFNQEELEEIYVPLQKIKKEDDRQLNVVLLILESFSKEYIGEQADGHSYTPFLDSLSHKSFSVDYAFANGKKSIEALPSILAGIPTLMNTAYISGKYSSNQIESLASVLKSKGYQTSFYHGGENGTMGFKAFTQIAGIDKYVGKDEYPYKDDYDGNWGIFDEPFLQFVSDELSATQQPFFTGIFTLSSHHPYTIPPQHQGKFKEGKLPILQSISYADYALKQFFKKAQQEDWFKNTLFIITADHTQHNLKPEYNNSVGIYRVPLMFYLPGEAVSWPEKNVAQQNDIFPTTLHLLGVKKEVVSFGNNLMNTNSFAVNYLNGIYQLIEGEYSLQFDGEKSIGLFNYQNDPYLKKNLLTTEVEVKERMEKKLKAIIQQYQQRLINNNLLPKQ